MLASAAAMIGIRPSFSKPESSKPEIKLSPLVLPVVISTWNHGIPANAAAWEILTKNGRALDAVEKGVSVTESDPKISSVGYGGLPDRDGYVTLDACIMDENLNGGSVACIEHIKNPISVARLVMEKTPHVMLVGDGALNFALENGFKKENLSFSIIGIPAKIFSILSLYAMFRLNCSSMLFLYFSFFILTLK